jgi:hypothetical protein
MQARRYDRGFLRLLQREEDLQQEGAAAEELVEAYPAEAEEEAAVQMLVHPMIRSLPH